MTIKHLLKNVVPPVLWAAMAHLRARRSPPPVPSATAMPEWQYIPEGWDFVRAHPEVKGWSVEAILEVYRHKWPRYQSLLEGTEPLGFTHESDMLTNRDVLSHNAAMSFAYVAALAAGSRGNLTMLDWGGGIGHYFALARAVLPGMKIEYTCKDVPILAEHGARLFPEQRFMADESCLARTYDLVMASTSLHYTENWRALLTELVHATSGYLYVANLPVVRRVPSFVFIQRPYRYGYETEYLGWCLNRDELIAHAVSAGAKLQREFVYGRAPAIDGAPEQNEYTGFLFTHGSQEAACAKQENTQWI
jgi:putative methyltransferase (TIGR04325 family)